MSCSTYYLVSSAFVRDGQIGDDGNFLCSCDLFAIKDVILNHLHVGTAIEFVAFMTTGVIRSSVPDKVAQAFKVAIRCRYHIA
jgi:hypothetical protein